MSATLFSNPGRPVKPGLPLWLIVVLTFAAIALLKAVWPVAVAKAATLTWPQLAAVVWVPVLALGLGHVLACSLGRLIRGTGAATEPDLGA